MIDQSIIYAYNYLRNRSITESLTFSVIQDTYVKEKEVVFAIRLQDGKQIRVNFQFRIKCGS